MGLLPRPLRSGSPPGKCAVCRVSSAGRPPGFVSPRRPRRAGPTAPSAPTPIRAGSAGCAPASVPTHPRRGRAMCTSRSTLTNDHFDQSSSAEMPLPESATSTARASPENSYPGRSGVRARTHAAAGPGTCIWPSTKRQSTLAPKPKTVSSGAPSSGTGHGGGVGTVATALVSVSRTNHTRPWRHSRPPEARTTSASAALRAARSTRTRVSSSATGTGPMNSAARRRAARSVRPVSAATARSAHATSSALGGPPCCSCSAQGPTVDAAGRNAPVAGVTGRGSRRDVIRLGHEDDRSRTRCAEMPYTRAIGRAAHPSRAARPLLSPAQHSSSPE